MIRTKELHIEKLQETGVSQDNRRLIGEIGIGNNANGSFPAVGVDIVADFDLQMAQHSIRTLAGKSANRPVTGIVQVHANRVGDGS